MHPARCALAAAALVVTVACGNQQHAANGPDWLTSTPRPVTLETTRDESRAATRLITPRGGTIIATGTDGTRYRLRIPEGAVLSPVEITMTPLSGVSGLPLAGGSAAAVQLEPSGLYLLQPAELSITPRTEVPAPQRVTYAYSGSGLDAHRYPVTSASDRIEMMLLHFSGYGVGVAPPDDPGRAALQQASSYEARLNARLAEAMDRDRASEDPLLSDETVALMMQSMVEYYDVILRPLMLRAETDWRMAECCMTRYTGWERTIQLQMVDTDGTTSPELDARRAQARESSERILRNYYDQGIRDAIRRCREDHELSAVRTVLAIARQAALLGDPLEGPAFDAIEEELTRCLRFDVEFHSMFDNGAPEATRMRYEVAAEVAVQLNPLGSERYVNASGPLDYVRFTATGNPKEAIWGRDGRDERTAWFDRLTSFRISAKGTRGSTFVVHAIEWDLNIIERPGTDCNGRDATMKADSVVDFSITFSPGVPVEVTHAEPVGSGIPAFDLENTAWARHWSRAHDEESVHLPGITSGDDEPGGAFRLKLERTGPGTWIRTFEEDAEEAMGFSLSERGHIVVRHEPG